MRISTRRLLAALTAGSVIVSGSGAFAFGTYVTHERLANLAVARANQPGDLDRFFRSGLGLDRGLDTTLGLQHGLTPDLDSELADQRVGHGDYGEGLFEGRLNRSPSAVD